MSSIMELIGLEVSELSALELENLPYLTMFILGMGSISYFSNWLLSRSFDRVLE